MDAVMCLQEACRGIPSYCYLKTPTCVRYMQSVLRSCLKICSWLGALGGSTSGRGMHVDTVTYMYENFKCFIASNFFNA